LGKAHDVKTIPGLFSLLLRLAKDRHARGHLLLARLLRDEAGAWLISTTLMLPVLIGVAGLGTEGGMLFYQHRSLQSAADAAAYSAAIAYSDSTSANITTQAQATVASYGFALGTGTNQANVTASATTFASQSAVQVTISRPQTAIFSSILFSVLPNSVSATAVINGGSNSNPSGTCLLALGKTSTGNNAADAIQIQGGGGQINIGVPGCGIFSNSTDCTSGSFSESFGGNAKIGTSTSPIGALGSAGCMTIFGNSQANLTGGVTCTSGNSTACTQNNAMLSDPYAGVSTPTTSSAGSCVASANVYCPGVYPNGLSLKGGTTTLSPGIYIMEGEFKVGPGGGGTTVNGSGVTLVFTSATPSASGSYPGTMMDIDSNANVTLTAPTTGATAGFVIMGDSTMPLNTSFNIVANATATLDGTVYVPNGAFSWGGNATTGGGSFCLQVIVNTIQMGGDSAFGGAGCSLSGGSGGQIQKPISSTVTLVD
jgi:Flp pilus assembly protein TadG